MRDHTPADAARRNSAKRVGAAPAAAEPDHGPPLRWQFSKASLLHAHTSLTRLSAAATIAGTIIFYHS